MINVMSWVHSLSKWVNTCLLISKTMNDFFLIDFIWLHVFISIFLEVFIFLIKKWKSWRKLLLLSNRFWDFVLLNCLQTVYRNISGWYYGMIHLNADSCPRIFRKICYIGIAAIVQWDLLSVSTGIFWSLFTFQRGCKEYNFFL